MKIRRTLIAIFVINLWYIPARPATKKMNFWKLFIKLVKKSGKKYYPCVFCNDYIRTKNEARHDEVYGHKYQIIRRNVAVFVCTATTLKVFCQVHMTFIVKNEFGSQEKTTIILFAAETFLVETLMDLVWWTACIFVGTKIWKKFYTYQLGWLHNH